MNSEPQIYTVTCFVPNEDGTYKLNVHYVAGTSSADAQERIEKSGVSHLIGRRFILTDEFLEVYPRTTILYATRYTNEDRMSEQALRKWVESSTTATEFDGETDPPAYREF